MEELRALPLAELHGQLGAKFVPFAGWSMPVQYSAGVMAEHTWCRTKAGLFDVSHMGQVLMPPDQAAGLEALVPVDVIGLAEGRQRYGLFTNAAGGVLDDLMIARRADDLFLVVNAGCAAADIAHLQAHLTGVQVVTDRALLALQGPDAEAALDRLVPGAAAMKFMDVAVLDWQGAAVWVSRSGYTGEDGYEVSVPNAAAEAFARALLADDRVAPIGLGARDSLRLEAGLPLYGQELGPDITPIEAGLGWAISKVRRAGEARGGGYAGAEAIAAQMAQGAPRRAVGLRPETRAPMRTGVPLFDAEAGGSQVGVVTSGGFGPTVGAPVALGLIAADISPDAPLWGDVRGKRLPVSQARLPFVPRGFKR